MAWRWAAPGRGEPSVSCTHSSWSHITERWVGRGPKDQPVLTQGPFTQHGLPSAHPQPRAAAGRGGPATPCPLGKGFPPTSPFKFKAVPHPTGASRCGRPPELTGLRLRAVPLRGIPARPEAFLSPVLRHGAGPREADGSEKEALHVRSAGCARTGSSR